MIFNQNLGLTVALGMICLLLLIGFLIYPQLGRELLTSGLVAGAIAFLISLSRWQNYIQKLPAGLEFSPTQTTAFPQLHQDLLTQYTTDLQSLGFIQLSDWSAEADVGSLPPMFSRLFQHPEHYCFAEVTQSFPGPRKLPPMRCSVSSLLDQGWVVRTTNESPSPISHLTHLSNQVWTYHPQATPTDLLNIHLGRRQQTTENLSLTVLTEITQDDLLLKTKETAWRQKQFIKRQGTIITLFKTWWLTLKPQYEWLGDPVTLQSIKRNHY